MASLWESLSSLFSPSPAPHTSSHRRTFSHRRKSSLFSSAFFSLSTENTTPPSADDNNLPMPPTTAITTMATGEVPSPTDSATPSPVTPGSDGYFPAPTTNPDSSTLSLLSNTSTDGALDARPAAPRRSATFVVAHDPLSRDYPKPAVEPGLEELLARKPGVWSLSHYVKNVREVGVWEVEAAERARKFEQVKRDLVAAKERFDGAGKV